MTKKDCELIAATFKSMGERSCVNTLDAHLAASWFADALERANPRFDRARFLKACGV